MHETSDNPEFINTIEDIKNAEKEHDQILEKAKEKSDRVLRDAKEKVYEEREKTEQKIVETKNEKIRQGSKEIESEVQGMVDEGKTQANETTTKKLDKRGVSKLVKDFLNSL